MKLFGKHWIKLALFGFLLLGLLHTPLFGAEGLPLNPEIQKVFNALQTPPGDTSTKVRYLWKNDEAWYTRWKMLESAKQTIDCTYFIVDKDVFGEAFLGHLAKKAREGIKIRLMVDGRIFRSGYMKGMPDKFQELAGCPNVEIKLYNAVSKALLPMFLDLKKMFASNHDKIIIIDGHLSIIGGRNIGPDYFAGKGEYPIVYRDTDVVMEGQHVAGQLKKAFEDEWVCLKNAFVKPDMFNFNNQAARLDLAYRAMNQYMIGNGLMDPKKITMPDKLKEALQEINKDLSNYKNISSYASFDLWRGERKKPVKIIDKYSHLGNFNDITKALIQFIDASKHEIWIQNSYVVLTDEAEKALKRASDRGVKVLFHTNSGSSTDALVTQAFFMRDWQRILGTMKNSRILVAPSANERLHSKTFVFDRQISIIGSYNMDPLSEQVNSEVVAAINDQSFGTMVANRIVNDAKVHVEYKVKVEANGKITPLVGPEAHVDAETIKKMNMYCKFQWIRPLI